MTTLRSLVATAISFVLVACGDDDAGGESQSKPSCAIGVTLSGDVTASLDGNDDLACLVLHSFESGVAVVFIPGHDVESIEFDIDDVTEGQTGAAFPASIGVNLEDGGDYATPPGACTASVTKHELERTEMSAIGELRHYELVGTASCAEPAVSTAPGTGPITFENVQFRMPAVWAD